MRIFNKIAQHFETRYWYHSRKIAALYFNEDSQKFENSFPKERAKDILGSYWNGEADLWRTFLLKLENMFWALHKNGVELDYYFYVDDIEKFASDDDKILISKKVINQTVAKGEKLWLFNGRASKNLSESGTVHFYLARKNDSDLILTCSSDKEIPQNLIPKGKKLYEIKTFKDENGKLQFEEKESPQYELKSEMTVIDFGEVEKENLAEKILFDVSAQFDEKINAYLKSHSEIKVDESNLLPLKKLVLKNLHECNGFEIAEIPNFSKKLKEHATGNFIKCKELMHLRHFIKKLLSVLENLHTEEGEQDRQDLYRQIFDFMGKNGMKWWD